MAIRSLAELPEKQATAYVKGRPSTIALFKVQDVWLGADTARAALAMLEAAAEDGVRLELNSGFRSMAEQRALWDAYQAGTGNLAARPGYSNHQGGIAVDVDTDGQKQADVERGRLTRPYRWLEENAARFGFVRTVPSEPWHWEFRGASGARKTAAGLALALALTGALAIYLSRRR